MENDVDLALALSLQDGEEAAVVMEESSMQKRGIVDRRWELTDPNPDIHQLFVRYDSMFFWSKLTASGVAVDWSKRMTLCAGVCSYESRAGFCSMRLSLPLLKLRPRRDLVETLLHEMIHAFLFVTHNNKDHDGHGPEFLSHMHRINEASGTRITVFHTFNNEVKQYRQHWWKCDGPCQKRSPFYGVVMRAMNRPPSSRDLWWAEHQRTCGGKHVKIKEPEGYGKKGKGKGQKESERGNRDIREMLGRKRESSEPSSQEAVGSSVDSSGAFEGQGFVLGTRTGKEGEGKRKKGESSKAEVAASVGEFSGAFEGQGFVLGTRAGKEGKGGKKKRGESSKQASQQEVGPVESRERQGFVAGRIGSKEDPNSHTDDLRANMLRAAERRRAQNEERLGVLMKRGRKSGSSSSCNSEQRTTKKPRRDSDCIVISDDIKDSTPLDSQSEQVLDLTEASPSPPAPQEWYRNMDDYKTCPVCGMANIPSAIINIHVSLCLEAEEEFKVILDDDDL